MYYKQKYIESIESLKSNINGLTNEEAKKRLSEYGYNELKEGNKVPNWKLFLESFKDPLVIILLIAAIVQIFLGEVIESIIIFIVIMLNSILGVTQTKKAEGSLESLKKLSAPKAKVIRDNQKQTIEGRELVPGDIVILEAGDYIPADGRIIDAQTLKIVEGMLTGESEPVLKHNEKIDEDIGIGDQKNMVFSGSLVVYGRGIFIVTSTGMNTEMGKVANLLETAENKQTPLQQKLDEFSKKLGVLIVGIAALIFIIQVIRNFMGQSDISKAKIIADSFMFAIAVAVAAIPEALSSIVTIVLSVGTNDMAKKQAIIRKLPAVETLGSTSVICTDKTGTLTQNKMMVEVAYVDGKYIDTREYKSNSYFEENCIVNSTADIEKEENSYKYIGSATECALLLYHRNKDYNKLRKETNLISQIPFSSDKKRMSSLINKEGYGVFLTKGAPEILLERCAYMQKGRDIVEMTSQMKKELLREIKKLQLKSMRTLGFAYKNIDISAMQVATTYDDEIAISECLEPYENDRNLIFGGFVGIIDPLRDGVKESIQIAYDAGVKVKMLTGDNINTAVAIGEEIGLLDDGKKAVEATYIDILTDEELREEINDISIVARSKPDTKMRIVQALQANSEVVAVTGDGINDAPALSKADVGISMGISGTEVSKNASDIILTDDSFSTIVDGIKWGRGIYENFQRFIQFQLTVNIVAFMIAVISQIMGREMPFTTIQLLWVNIIMDGPPALAGLEPVRDYVIKRKPIKRNAGIIARSMYVNIIINAFLIMFIVHLQEFFNILNATPQEKGTVVFSLFAFSALFNALNCREFGLNSTIPNLFKNKLALEVIFMTAVAQIVFTQVFKGFFNSVALSVSMWIKIILLSSMVLVLNEIVKFVFRVIKKQGNIVRGKF